MARNYYVILGIGSDATPDQIKSAYRQKAKSVHPDCSGGGCEPFHDIQQAYKVLSDPARRKTYDDELARVGLTWEQARHGGDVRIWLPTQTPCPACRGQRASGFFPCPHCSGSGVLGKEVPLSISFPAGAPDGAIARLPLGQFGIHHTSLLVHFRVRR